MFRRGFTKSSLRRIYDERVLERGPTGLDRISPRRFATRSDEEIDTVYRKIRDGTYAFTPYAETLLVRGKNRTPRVLSLPTVRDRIVLAALKDLLHQCFPDRVARDLPNTLVRRVLTALKDRQQDGFAFIRADIKSFYDQIRHADLFDFIQARVRSKKILRLLGRAIKTPTVSVGSRRHDGSRGPRTMGIAQGLSVSNILAAVLLTNLDETLSDGAIGYFRYVDDLLILLEPEDVERKYDQLVDGLNALSLELNPNKSWKGKKGDPFDFLGYHFGVDQVTIRQASVDRFLARVAAAFTQFRKRPERSPFGLKVDEVVAKQLFVEALNEHITGAISERRQYGWLFYYSEITDLALLHRLDAIIRRFFTRLPQFNGQAPADVKRLARAYWEVRHDPRGGYVHDYDQYSTPAAQLLFLQRSGELDEDQAKRYTESQIGRLFQRIRNQRLGKLDADVATVS